MYLSSRNSAGICSAASCFLALRRSREKEKLGRRQKGEKKVKKKEFKTIKTEEGEKGGCERERRRLGWTRRSKCRQERAKNIYKMKSCTVKVLNETSIRVRK